MANGPQQFEIPLSDQLFPTYNPADPVIGIAPSALVPVTIPWNAERTGLDKVDGKDKEVVFGKIKWSGAGTGPYDVYTEQIGGTRTKSGTVAWSIETEVSQELETVGARRRWRITPTPTLFRTFTPLQGAADVTNVASNPQVCYGNWVPV